MHSSIRALAAGLAVPNYAVDLDFLQALESSAANLWAPGRATPAAHPLSRAAPARAALFRVGSPA